MGIRNGLKLPFGRGIIALFVFALLGGVAAADDSGGRIGGGDWSGGGDTGGGYSGGGYSSSNDYTPSYSYSNDYSSSHDYNDYSYTSSSRSRGLPAWAYLLILVIGIVIRVAKEAGRSSYSPMPYTNYSSYTPADAVDVGVMRIAVDGRSRKYVQDELAKIAAAADTATAEGRQTTLREVTTMLRRIRDAWVYGGAVNEPMTAKMNGKQIFDRHVDATRAKFRHETVSNVQGSISTSAAPDYTARSHEGQGVILVSIIIATRTELFTISKIGDGEDLRKALESAGSRTANDIVALEIIWQPSVDGDRMSSIELEQKYPNPSLIKIQNALVGKTFCTYCAGPFPAELVSCPHCGAPSREA